MRFDQIQGSGGVGHSFFQITVFNAQDDSQSYSYTFATNTMIGGDEHVIVSPGETLQFEVDFASDFFDKYGINLPEDIILRLRSSVDYAEGAPPGQQVRTAEVAVDNISVFAAPQPCPADFDGDGDVDAADLAELLVTWGPCS